MDVNVNGRPIDYTGLPERLRAGMQMYIEQHCATGRFLWAVLANDLRGACERADAHNQPRLFEIVRWLHNNAPAACWGSPENVDAWLRQEAA